MDYEIGAFSGGVAVDRFLVGRNHVERLFGDEFFYGSPLELEFAGVVGLEREILAVGRFDHPREVVSVFQNYCIRTNRCGKYQARRECSDDVCNRFHDSPGKFDYYGWNKHCNNLVGRAKGRKSQSREFFWLRLDWLHRGLACCDKMHGRPALNA